MKRAYRSCGPWAELAVVLGLFAKDELGDLNAVHDVVQGVIKARKGPKRPGLRVFLYH